MRKIKPVPVPKAAFAFCRLSLMILLWIAFIFKIYELVVLTAVILFLSYLLKIQKAPMIVLYKYTVEKIKPSKIEYLDEYSMKFAHLLGSILLFITVILLYTVEPYGYALLFIMCLLKTLGAAGYCTASKLYGCINSDSCCSFIGKKNAR